MNAKNPYIGTEVRFHTPLISIIHWRTVVILTSRRIQPVWFSPLQINWDTVWIRSPSGKFGKKKCPPYQDLKDDISKNQPVVLPL